MHLFKNPVHLLSLKHRNGINSHKLVGEQVAHCAGAAVKAEVVRLKAEHRNRLGKDKRAGKNRRRC